jgi:hypothetical protein
MHRQYSDLMSLLSQREKNRGIEKYGHSSNAVPNKEYAGENQQKFTRPTDFITVGGNRQ